MRQRCNLEFITLGVQGVGIMARTSYNDHGGQKYVVRIGGIYG